MQSQAFGLEDSVWLALRGEAQDACNRDSALLPLFATILEAASFEEALIHHLSARLGDTVLPAGVLAPLLLEPVGADPSIGDAARADLIAAVERDPASERLLEPFVFFKGYAALQTHRLAHWFWNSGKRDIALYLQSRSSGVFHTDIHPAARFGKGIFLDHATGFVAGETVTIEDNVSMLHGVTLGGSGIEKGERHPRIRTGVLIGAGAQILGNIEIGAFSKIAGGSLVTQSVPPRCTAAGVPARIIEGAGSAIPAQSMDQKLAAESYESFTYAI